MGPDNLKFEEVQRYLVKNRPTEKIENIYKRKYKHSHSNQKHGHSNPLLELMRVNFGMHNDLVARCYDQWVYCGNLGHNKIIDYMVDCKISENVRYEISYHVLKKLPEFEEPLIDIMNTSSSLRKTGLQEIKRHMIYHAMDRAGERDFKNNFYGIRKDEVLRPFKLAITLDEALRREFE